jgi:transcriptional regulator GlxA family with amidase domain
MRVKPVPRVIVGNDEAVQKQFTRGADSTCAATRQTLIDEPRVVACVAVRNTDARMSHSPPCIPDFAVQKAVEIIEHRYGDRLSLVQLGRETGMSRYRLSHRFSQAVGMSLRKYLLTVRLEHAKDLLADGHVSITEVAQDVGFGDLPRFDKLFRRYTGLTPSAFRMRSAAS